ncbi:hypothetical protein LJC26_01980 [Desulfovibrio sp. OttesenSCG-928-O18]|nr:hypothetical protein [Desulfovibrio sp. OttesenSCG-928-O18]
MAITDILAYGGNSRIGSVASSFASDLTRRISGSRGLDASQEPVTDDPELLAAQEAKTAQLQKLESALGSSVAYMANKHGEQAASAMIGIIYKRLGESEINEQTLGNALLDVTRFIDSNFGTDKGDDFMDHLNGNLNVAMNEFFDNGQNETFFASSGLQGGGSGGSVSVEGLLQQLTEEYTESIKTMLEEARAKKPEEGSPLAAYAQDWEKGALQGVMKDLMV